MRRFRSGLLLILLSVVVAACQPQDSQPGGAPTTGPAPTSTIAAADPLAERLDWFVAALDAGTVSEPIYQGTFTADFLENVSYQDFVSALAQISTTGTNWSVVEFEEREDNDATVLVGADNGEQVRVAISIESTVPYRIAGLLLQPAEPPELDEPPADIESAAERLGQLGTTDLMVAEVRGGVCEPVYEAGAGDPVPVGSAIKLYVLGAVADAVADGTIAWDDDVVITDSLKSIPTGVLQDEEEGTEFSVRQISEAMIALSDNTATDHLIDLVTRERVEAALSDYGMGDPALNIPFMNTLELAALKVGPAAGLATQWVVGGEAERRSILDQISDITPADIPLAEFTEPSRVDEVEWFATPADICRVLVRLYESGDPLTKILTINPGLVDESEDFTVIAFKGGSEPGLISMNWLVERPDGRRFVVAGSVVNAVESFDQLEATLLFGAIRDLVLELP